MTTGSRREGDGNRELPGHVPEDASGGLDPGLPVIDQGFLDDLEFAARRTGNPSLPFSTLMMLRESGPLLLAKLQTGIAAGDAKAVAEAAHSLKSSSGALGAARVSALCHRLQLLGRSAALGGAPGLLAAIEAEYAAAMAALLLAIPRGETAWRISDEPER